MTKILWRIILCIFIKKFVVFNANAELATSLPREQSTSTIDFKGAKTTLSGGNAETTAPLIREGPTERASVISVNGTIKTIREQVLDGIIKVVTPVTVHATLENKTYLLVNQTFNDKTTILVYIAIDNTTTYLQAGSLKTSTELTPTGKTFSVDRYEDVIDVLPTNLIEPLSDHLKGNYTIDVANSVLLWCPEVRIEFLLFTQSNPDNYQELFLNDVNSINKSYFNASKKTTVLVHGWLYNGTQPGFPSTLKQAILKADDRNVIVVSWTSKSLYHCALAALKPVGREVARFLDFMIKQIGVNISSFHVMGHSLGGHIAGFIGKEVTSGRLSRITGFDPAGPFIFCSDKKNCINKEDAGFVDVIHTDGERLGKSKPLGHVDFYPNGGKHTQPPCEPEFLITMCSHISCFLYYAEAISAGESGPKFYAAKSNSYEHFKGGICTAKNEFGPNAKKEPQGLYYFITNSSKPYALGDNGLGQKCLDSIQGV